MSNTRLVNLDAEIITVGIVSGLLHERFAVAKTDFKDSCCGSPEHGVQIKCCAAEVDTISWP